MLRATPWLGAVLAACLMFSGALCLSRYVLYTEDIGSDRIQGIMLTDDMPSVEGVAVSDYEIYLMSEYMSTDSEAIELIAKAYAETQAADKNSDFYKRTILYTEDGPVTLDGKPEFVYI